jgi:hypothetical protein
MNAKQLFLIFFFLILGLAVITLPIWIEGAIPVINRNLDSAANTLEHIQAALKFFGDNISMEFWRLLDKYVFKN